MTDHAEVAGNLQIEIFYYQKDANTWLMGNGDCEVVDIQITGAPRNIIIMITYRKES
ncbi:MAG: hypothetical protein K0S80_3587 [Neobacillus sp.]|nr:hypothetical protein [Neobacillus sp.]